MISLKETRSACICTHYSGNNSITATKGCTCTHPQHLSPDSKYMYACVVHVQKLYMCIATDYTVHVKIKNLSMQSMPSYLNAD